MSSFDDEGLSGNGETALSIGANTFAFFTRNPRGGKAKDLDMDDVAACASLCRKTTLDRSWLMPVYLQPLLAKERARELPWRLWQRTCSAWSAARQLLQLPSRCACGAGPDAGIQMIVDALCQVMFEGQQTTVLLETMSARAPRWAAALRNWRSSSRVLPANAPSCRPSWAFAGHLPCE
ncbi:MAG: hypothetical protein ACLTYW_04725 [Collinsella sp.]